MTLPELGLAASARDWSDRLHRFLLDHGGGTVQARVMSPGQAVSARFDVLFIDDVCSFLNQRLVVDIRSAGKSIVGVFDPADGSDAKRRLLEVGISDVIESDATPEEFLGIATSTMAHVAPPPVVEFEPDLSGYRIGLTGPPGGVGVTEIACGLAMDLSERHKTALVDMNLTWPSIGQRLGLAVHPNLRTAIDHALHEPDRLGDAIHTIGSLKVVAGLANPGTFRPSPSDLVGLVSGMARRHSHIVIDLGHYTDADSHLFRCLDALLVVGRGEPVGVTRLVRAFEQVAGLVESGCEIGLVVNRADRAGRKRDEIIDVLGVPAPGVPVVLISEDRTLRRPVWDGSPVGSGSFNRSVRRLGKIFDRVGTR